MNKNIKILNEKRFGFVRLCVENYDELMRMTMMMVKKWKRF